MYRPIQLTGFVLALACTACVRDAGSLATISDQGREACGSASAGRRDRCLCAQDRPGPERALGAAGGRRKSRRRGRRRRHRCGRKIRSRRVHPACDLCGLAGDQCESLSEDSVRYGQGFPDRRDPRGHSVCPDCSPEASGEGSCRIHRIGAGEARRADLRLVRQRFGQPSARRDAEGRHRRSRCCTFLPGRRPAITDVIGGQVDSAFSSVPSVLQMVRSGNVRALAVSSAQRISIAPEIPTIAESGFPGFRRQPVVGDSSSERNRHDDRTQDQQRR